jgi:hypothetical protein
MNHKKTKYGNNDSANNVSFDMSIVQRLCLVIIYPWIFERSRVDEADLVLEEVHHLT